MPIAIHPPSGQEAVDWQKWAQSLIQIVGGFAAGWFAHILTGRREHRSAADARKRLFLAAMRQWRAEIDRLHLHDVGFMRHPAVFLDGISGFMAEVEMIRADFTARRRGKFEELIARVPKCDPHKTGDILKAIDDVCVYVEKA